MKKLVMLLTLAGAVVSAKAACVDWAVDASADEMGKTVYLLTAAPGDYANMEAFIAAANSSATVEKKSRSYLTPTVTAFGEDVTSSSEFYFAIIADDGKSFNYVAATGMNAKVYDPDAQGGSEGTFDAVTAADILAGSSKTFGGDTPEPIPEPTSGLLLALGGAMLALRRRRA